MNRPLRPKLFRIADFFVGFDFVSLWFLKFVITRPGGLEPPTFGFEGRKSENLNTSNPDTYHFSKNDLTINLTKNEVKIHKDLQKIINRWSSLPDNIKTAIIVLVGDYKDE